MKIQDNKLKYIYINIFSISLKRKIEKKMNENQMETKWNSETKPNAPIVYP